MYSNPDLRESSGQLNHRRSGAVRILSGRSRAVRILSFLSPTAAMSTAVSLILAISTSNWLYTEEKFKNTNRTILYGRNSSPEYHVKMTVSGMWTLCQTKIGGKEFSCLSIDYFPDKEYIPEDEDSTQAIPYAVVQSSTYFLLGTFLVLVAEFHCIVGLCIRRRKIFVFISGIIFVLGGLILLAGLIVYISIFKAEVGVKLEARSALVPARFTYRYGFSFLLMIVSLLLSEASGTCAIFLFIYHHQENWRNQRRNPHAFSNGLCKVRQPLMSTGGSYPQPATGPFTRHSALLAGQPTILPADQSVGLSADQPSLYQPTRLSAGQPSLYQPTRLSAGQASLHQPTRLSAGQVSLHPSSRQTSIGAPTRLSSLWQGADQSAEESSFQQSAGQSSCDQISQVPSSGSLTPRQSIQSLDSYPLNHLSFNASLCQPIASSALLDNQVEGMKGSLASLHSLSRGGTNAEKATDMRGSLVSLAGLSGEGINLQNAAEIRGSLASLSSLSKGGMNPYWDAGGISNNSSFQQVGIFSEPKEISKTKTEDVEARRAITRDSSSQTEEFIQHHVKGSACFNHPAPRVQRQVSFCQPQLTAAPAESCCSAVYQMNHVPVEEFHPAVDQRYPSSSLYDPKLYNPGQPHCNCPSFPISCMTLQSPLAECAKQNCQMVLIPRQETFSSLTSNSTISSLPTKQDFQTSEHHVIKRKLPGESILKNRTNRTEGQKVRNGGINLSKSSASKSASAKNPADTKPIQRGGCIEVQKSEEETRSADSFNDCENPQVPNLNIHQLIRKRRETIQEVYGDV